MRDVLDVLEEVLGEEIDEITIRWSEAIRSYEVVVRADDGQWVRGEGKSLALAALDAIDAFRSGKRKT